MLLDLTLTNWKQHRNLTVNFSDGLTLVTGPNYSGKSNLVKAIGFALGGVTMIPGTADSITTRGEKRSSTKVKLSWRSGEDVYQVERSLSTAKLRRNGTTVATGNTAVNEEIEKIIGVDKKTFTTLKYVRQGETQALLTLGSGKLHSLMEALSGADLVAQVVTILSAHINHLEGQEFSIGTPNPEIGQIAQWKAEYDTKLTGWHEQIVILEEQVAKANQAYQETNDELNGLIQYNRTNRELAAAMAHYQATSGDLAKRHAEQVAEKSRLEPVACQLDSLSRQLEDMRKEKRNLAGLYQALKDEQNRLADLRRKYAEETNSLHELGLAYSQINLEEDDVKQAVAVAQTASQSLGEARARAKAIYEMVSNAVCPTCNRPFEGHDPEKLAAEREAADAAESTAAEFNDFAVGRMQDLQAEWTKKGKLGAQISSKEEQIASISRAIEATAISVKETRNDYETLCDKVGDRFDEHLDHQERVVSEARQAFGALSSVILEIQRIEAAQRQLGETPPPAEPLKVEQETAAREKLALVQQQWSELSGRLTKWKEYYATEYGKWQGWCQELKREEERSAKVASLVSERATAANLQKFLRKNRDRFMSELWAQVTAMASEFCSMCTGGVVTAVKRTDDGAFRYVEGGVEDSVVEASGAQRSIMSIGLLVALNKLIPGSFGALIMDEPSADMDEAHAATVTNALAKAGSQLVIISHRSMETFMAGSHIHLS